ncbi:MAG TPA: Gfo/Idh/MocA family oxidoreductase [Actinopolymorphaceae bacterium]
MDVARLALVGLGSIGLQAHLPAMLRSDAVDVVALADPSATRRELAAAAVGPGVPLYPDADELIGRPDVDAVVLATPPWVTTRLASEFLRTGTYVLAEKPVATSVAAAAPLVSLPAPLQERLQLGLTYRHDPALARLRQWVRDELRHGPLLIRAHIYDERRDPADPEHTARIRTTLEHGPPVVHEGAHVFDWLAFLMSEPRPQIMDAWASRTDPLLAAPNLNGVRLAYRDGTMALVEFGWLTDELPRCEVSVLGQRGYAVLDGFTFRLRVATAEHTEVVEYHPDRTTRCFDRQLASFVRLVAGEVDESRPNLADGLAALELAEAVVREATKRSARGNLA